MAKKIIIAGHEIASKTYVDESIDKLAPIYWNEAHDDESSYVFWTNIVNDFINTDQLPNVFRKKNDRIYKLTSLEADGTNRYRAIFSYENTRLIFTNGIMTPNQQGLYIQIILTDGIVTTLYENTSGWNNAVLYDNNKKTSTVLAIDNTTEYTPTRDYNPATKKYVDDAVANIESSDSTILWDGDHTTEEAITLFQKMWDAYENGEALPDVRVWDEHKLIQYRLFNVSNLLGSKFAAFACVNTAINAVINRRVYYFTVTDGIVTSINEPQQTAHAVLPEYNADNSNGVLRANNTIEFTPTEDYNPATKKYIDDKVTETVIITIRNAGAGFEWGDVKTQLKEKFYDRHSITNQNSFKYLFFFNSGVMTNTDVNVPDGLYYYDAWGTGIDYLHSVDTQTSVVDGQLVKTYCKITITKTKSTGSDKYDTISSIKAENIVLETSNLEGDLSDYYTKLETEDYVNTTIDNALETVTLDKLPTDKVVQLRDGYGSVGTIYVNKIKSALKNTATGKSIKLIEEFVTNEANQEQYGQYFMIFGHKSATTNNKLLGYMTNYPELLKMNPDSTMNYYGIYEADKPVYSLTTNADSTEVIVAQISSTTAGTPYTSSWYWNTGTYYNNLYLRSNCDILYRTNSGNAIDGIYLELDGSTGHNGAGEIQIMPDCPVIFYLDGQMTPPHGETVLGYKEGTTFLVGGSLYKSVFDGIKSGSNVSYELYIGGDYDNYATKEELNNAIGNITSFSLMPVDALPTENIQTNVIYLLPSENPEEENIRIEYVYINGAWEKIGTTEIDLSNYYTKKEVEANYYSKEEIDAKFTEIMTILPVASQEEVQEILNGEVSE